MTAQFDEMRKTLALLEELARSYPPSSDEATMIESAAKAVVYVNGEAVREQWHLFLENFSRDLTPEELEEVRRKTAR